MHHYYGHSLRCQYYYTHSEKLQRKLTKLVMGLCRDDGELQLEVDPVAVCSIRETLYPRLPLYPII